MTFSEIPKGTVDWDVNVNAAFMDIQNQITDNDSDISTVQADVVALEKNMPEGPVRHGLHAWAGDPTGFTGGTEPTGGNIQMVRVTLAEAAVISNVVLPITTAGSGLTAGQNWAGVYDSTGLKVAESADQTVDWATNGVKTIPMGVPYGATPGDYYVAFVANGTTRPTFLRGLSTTNVPTILSYGETAPNLRYALGPMAATTLPASIDMNTRTNLGVAWWVGVS